MTNLVTTLEISKQAGIGQRTIQKRIKRLKIQPIRAGTVFLLTLRQAERVLADKRKPGPKPAQSNSNGHK
jgi:hypothetical protein